MEKISPDSRMTKTESEKESAQDKAESKTQEPSFAMERLSFDEEASSQSASSEAAVAAPLADSASGDLSGEELEMIKSELPDPKVEAGQELLQSIESIPQKMAFKIGEAADMVGVKQYVLRYWETEFEMLRPKKSKNNQRVYSRRDVQTAMMIKKLLYEDRFSIEGARSALKQLKNQVKEEKSIQVMAQSQETAVMKLRGLVTEIRRIRAIFG